MIDRWLLPGPARLVSDIVQDLMEGRQLLLRHRDAPDGLRLILEDALQARQRALRSIYDHDAEPPLTVIRRAMSEGFDLVDTIPPGAYWVEEIAPRRATAWCSVATELAEGQRNYDPWNRVQIVVILSSDSAARPRLDVAERSVEVLTRLDLEVRARYAAAADGGDAKSTLRVTLAVELSQALLPALRALDALDYWLAAPDAALGSGKAMRAHAAAGGWPSLDEGEALLALWRAQQSVLLGLIDAERLKLVRQNPGLWKLPYTPVYNDGTSGRRVDHPELLEIGHLCTQAYAHGLPAWGRLRRRLDELRSARNALSHLEALTFGEIARIFLSTET